MGLILRHDNFYEKRVTEMGFAMMCLSTHKVFLNVHMCIVFFIYSMHKKIANAVDDGIFFTESVVYS